MPDPAGAERPVFLAANGRRARAMRLAGGLVSLATVAWLAALVAGATAVNGVPRLALAPGGGGGPARAQFASLKTGGGVRATASRRRAIMAAADPDPVAVPVSLTRRVATAPRGRLRRLVGRRTRRTQRAPSRVPSRATAGRVCRTGIQSGAPRGGANRGRGLATCASGIV
jgi:hypothetical protein